MLAARCDHRRRAHRACRDRRRPTTTRTKRSRGSRVDRLEQLRVALLRDQSPDGADDDGVVVDAERRPDGVRVRRAENRAGSNRVRSTPLPSSSALPREVPSAHELEVLGVLDQLRVGEPGRRTPRGSTPRPDGRSGRRSVAYSPWTVLTTIGTRASRPTTRPYRPGFGLCVCSTSTCSRRRMRQSSRAARTSAAGSIARVDDASRDVADPLAPRARPTHGPGALMPIGDPAEIADRAELRERRKRRLMSTVVRCATVRRRPRSRAPAI